MKKRWFLLIIVLLFFVPLISYSHSGRTDSSGGHWDRSTGTYHYHNGGGSSSYSNAVSYSTTTPTASTVEIMPEYEFKEYEGKLQNSTLLNAIKIISIIISVISILFIIGAITKVENYKTATIFLIISFLIYLVSSEHLLFAYKDENTYYHDKYSEQVELSNESNKKINLLNEETKNQKSKIEDNDDEISNLKKKAKILDDYIVFYEAGVKVYHKLGCKELSSADRIKAIDIKTAKEAGFEVCEICNKE